MKQIHIIATKEGRILAVAYASDIPKLLNGETIVREWFYTSPKELKDFLRTIPDQLQNFLDGFSNWIEFRVKGYAKKQTHYQEFKKTIQDFNKMLFEKLKNLAARIAKQVKKTLKPKEIIEYEETLQETVLVTIPIERIYDNNGFINNQKLKEITKLYNKQIKKLQQKKRFKQ